MDSGVAAIIGAFIGASAGLGTGLSIEAFKHKRDRAGTAAAIAGEIRSILSMTNKRQYVQFFEGILPRLKAGQDETILSFLAHPTERDPVIDRYLLKLGLLGPNLAERVVQFYSQLGGIRYDMVRLTNNELAGRPDIKARFIENDLDLWRDTEALGKALIEDLHKLCASAR